MIWPGSTGRTTLSSAGAGNARATSAHLHILGTDQIADARRPEPVQAGDVPGVHRFRRRRSPRGEAFDAGDALLDLLQFAEGVAMSQHRALPHRQVAREEAYVDDLLTG